MYKLDPQVKMFLDLAKIQAVMSRRFDNGLGGLGFNEFIILFNLSQAEKETMRRIDLAEKIGLTASGVTRILLPMEKIGLVESGANENDARVRTVRLASGGRRRLAESIERAELLARDIMKLSGLTSIDKFSEKVAKLADRIR